MVGNLLSMNRTFFCYDNCYNCLFLICDVVLLFLINSPGRCESPRSRLHQSEPSLCLTTHSPNVPRLQRLQSLPVHEDSDDDDKVPNLLVKVGIMGVVKVPMRRKLSLSNLFAKSGYKGKVPKARESNTLSIPSDSEAVAISSPLTRVRSRSAPFCEMSPIQENHGESFSDSQESGPSPENKVRIPIVIQSSDSDVAIIKCNQEKIDKSIGFLEPEDPSFIFYSTSSDDSCSTDSERLPISHLVSSTERERLDRHPIERSGSIEISHDLPSNVELIATTHPPLPEMQPVSPNPNRSPRCSATSPVELNKPALISMNPASSVLHGMTPTRPSPCPRRSSESEINTTPKGSNLILLFYILLFYFILLFTASSLTDSVGSSGGNMAPNCRPYRQTSVPAPPTSTYPNVAEVSNMEILEYPFLTLKTYPPGFIVHIGKSFK